jgi:hypothetical protein
VFYFEKPGGYRFDVIVATSAHGDYLKTVTDRHQPYVTLAVSSVHLSRVGDEILSSSLALLGGKSLIVFVDGQCSSL